MGSLVDGDGYDKRHDHGDEELRVEAYLSNMARS